MNRKSNIKSKIFPADGALVTLIVGCFFITLWMVGAGWLDVEKLTRLGNGVVGVGIAAAGYFLKRGNVQTHRDAEESKEEMRREMQSYYRGRLAKLADKYNFDESDLAMFGGQGEAQHTTNPE